MEEESKQIEAKPFSLTMKMNAKGEIYGEVSVRADTSDELEDKLIAALDIFHRHRKL